MFMTLAAMALAAQSAPNDQARVDQKCAEVGDAAERIMTTRQAEVPMSKVMAAAAKVPEGWRDTLRRIVVSAYEKPTYYSPQAKAEEVMRFRNEWKAACYRDLAAK